MSGTFPTSPSWRLQFQSILTETDPGMRAEDLLRLAADCEAREEGAAAAEIYARMLAGPLPESFAERARRGMEALQGRAGFGRRFEDLSRAFVRQALAPQSIASMLAGSLAYSLGRTLVLGRLAAAPAAWWSRGLGARAAAGALGFAAELPAFVGLQRALLPSPQGLGHDLRAAALSLGTLKLFAFGGRQALAGSIRLPILHPGLAKAPGVASVVIPQSSALLGLMAAHRLEAALGWRPATDAPGLLTESLATLLSLGVGSRLGTIALGRKFGRFQQELALRAELQGGFAERWSGRKSRPGAFIPAPGLALAGAGVPESAAVQDSARAAPLLMSSEGEGGPSRPGMRGRSRGMVYREAPNSLTAEDAALRYPELRKKVLSKRETSEARLQVLEELETILKKLEGRPQFSQGLADLRRLIGDPEIEWKHPVKMPEQSLPIYARHHLLQQRAAETYVRLLESYPLGHPEIEAGIAQLREALTDPRLPTRFQGKGEWRKFYEESVDDARRQLLPFYIDLLPRLATESPEVREGGRLLNSEPWQEFLARSDGSPEAPGLGGRLRQETAVAYAFLLSASTAFQREINPDLVKEMPPHLSHLRHPVERGDPRAISAAARVATLGADFQTVWIRMMMEAKPALKEVLRAAENEAKEVKKLRDGEVAERALVQATGRKGLLGRAIDVLIVNITKPWYRR
ncbi:MAG: hypothetical protein IT573_12480 [Deltaproteobacteria bacterium]|nr:hypothetical protein [Deltaproteobacteria bacterium]